jgi:Ca2+-binding RTX toxin-like protein
MRSATILSGHRPDETGKPNVIRGTSQADSLSGTAGDDVINGLGGNDYLLGGGGDDTLNGGVGNDRALDFQGGSVMYGGTGDDTLSGSGDTRLFGDSGRDMITGSLGQGQAGSIYLDGGLDDDTVHIFGMGTEIEAPAVAFGGDGDDLIAVTNFVGARVDGGDGRDKIFLNDSRLVEATLGAGADVIRFQNSNWAETSVSVTDFQTGVGGDALEIYDWLWERLENWDGNVNPFTVGYLQLIDTADGAVLQVSVAANGAWSDLVTFQGVAARALTAANLGGFPADGGSSPGKRIKGTDGGETLNGGSGGDTIDGLGGNDAISGGAGDDLIKGGAGDDWVTGGLGSDVMRGGVGDDNISDNDGAFDKFYGEAGNDFVNLIRNGQAGAVLVDGGDGDDYLGYSGAGDNRATLDGGAGNDRAELNTVSHVAIDLGGGADELTLQGLQDDVEITLGAGADTIVFDIYMGAGTRLEVMDFSTAAGGDRIDLEQYTYSRLTGGFTNPFGDNRYRIGQSGGDAILQINQDGLDDDWIDVMTLKGVDAQTLNSTHLVGPFDGPVPGDLWRLGADGSDELTASSRFHHLDGGGGNDSLRGDGSDNIIRGDEGADTMTGGQGADHITGGEGSDRMLGGGGNDTLCGAGGADALNGGGGRDVFKFLAASDSARGGVDLIEDLSSADTIDLSQIDARADQFGDHAFTVVRSFHAVAGELVMSYAPKGDVTVIQADIDGDGRADVKIEISGDHRDFSGLLL